MVRPGANQKDLVLYLEGFDHTLAVMQTREALMRVAAECAEDLAADGIVYAEIRFAPELHTEGGLGLDDVVGAVIDGFAVGSERAAAAGHPITVYALLTAMRTQARSVRSPSSRCGGVTTVSSASTSREPRPASRPPAISTRSSSWQRENFHITIHAGEAFGLPSIWEALQWCGAERLGHGVRIVDDITEDPDGRRGAGTSRGVRARSTRAARDVPDVERAHRRGPVDRRASDRPAATAALPGHGQHRQPAHERHVDDSKEFAALVDTFGYGWDDVEWLTTNAMKSAFARFDERLRIINERIKPGYALLKAEEVTVGSR